VDAGDDLRGEPEPDSYDHSANEKACIITPAVIGQLRTRRIVTTSDPMRFDCLSYGGQSCRRPALLPAAVAPGRLTTASVQAAIVSDMSLQSCESLRPVRAGT